MSWDSEALRIPATAYAQTLAASPRTTMKKQTDFDKLTKELKEVKAENEALKGKIIELDSELKRERRKRAVDSVLLEYHQRQFTIAAADLILNPDPIKVHGTFDNKGLDFWIKLADVVVVKSNERIKEIFLKTSIRPEQGGKNHKSIMINDNKINFEKVLQSIQGRSTHLLRVNKSMAVNLHHYDLADERTLTLNIEKRPVWLKDFSEVKTDKFFKLDVYHRRKYEIQEVYRYKKS